MNAIIQFTQTSEFTKEAQLKVRKLRFSVIPEMRVIENKELIDHEEKVVSKTISYQAEIKDTEDYENSFSLLSEFGAVDLIGTWNEDGSIITLDINKYRDALNDIQIFEVATFYNGVDYTGKEETYIHEKDEEGNDIKPSVKTFTRLKESKRPTLAQAKETQVNSFNRNFVRKLK